ncbi:MAG: hypothetical protein ACREUX_19025, partial [Burkholderiales bacterium]
MEPVFVFLVHEYRQQPRHAAALALYDMFCAPGAPARLDAHALLPPMNLTLAACVRTLRAQWLQMYSAEPADAAIPTTVPMRGMFDRIVDGLTQIPAGRWARLGLYYNPARDPAENLPGGRMTPAQRHFVENIWKPRVRPCLVSAGFWQMQTIE